MGNKRVQIKPGVEKPKPGLHADERVTSQPVHHLTPPSSETATVMLPLPLLQRICQTK